MEYDGSGFSGWAKQPGRRTVEGELSKALATVLRHEVSLSVAGRTDAGVHASGQVVSFDTDSGMDPQKVSYRTTAVLPKDAALRRCVAVPDSFDARREAKSRSYEYCVVASPVRSPLLRGRAAHVFRGLDEGLLSRAATLVRGAHDFRAFTPRKTYHKRFERVVSDSRWAREGETLTYRVTANSFLYGMVRALVGTMLQVSSGDRSLEGFEALLEGGERERAGPSAPARGLTLVGVGYDGLPELNPVSRPLDRDGGSLWTPEDPTVD